MRISMRTAAFAAALLSLAACSQRPAAGGHPMARVALGVGRSAVAQLPGSTRLALSVSAADMAPVNADLPLDGSTTTLEVPAGTARLFTLDAFNAVGRSHTGSTLVPELVAGAPTRVTIHLAPLAGATGPSRWLVYHRFASPGQVGSLAAAREDGGASVTLATVADGGDVRYAGFSADRVLFTRAQPGGMTDVGSVKPDGSGEAVVHKAEVTGASLLATLGDTVITSDDGTLYLARVDGAAAPVLLGDGSGAQQTFRSDGRTQPPDGQAEGRFWFLAFGTGRSGTWSIGPGEAAPSLVTDAYVEIAAVEETPLGRRVFLANLDGQLFATDPSGAPAVKLATDFDGSLLDLGLPVIGVARPTPLPLVLVGDRVVYPADDGAGGKYLASVGLDGSGHEVVSPVGAALHLLGASATQAYAALDGGGSYEPVACDVPAPGVASCGRSFYTGERAGEAAGWGLIVNAASLDAVPFDDGSSRRLAAYFARDLWGDGSQATSPWAVQAGDLLVHALDFGGDQDLVASLPDGGGRFDLAASGWNEALVGLSGARAVYTVDVGGQRDLASSVVDQRLGAARAQVSLSSDPADERVVALDGGTVFFTRELPGGGRDFHAVLDDGSRHARLTDEPGVVKGFAGLITFAGPALPARLDTLAVTCAATDLVVGVQTTCGAAGTLTDGSAANLSGLSWSILQPGVLAVDAAGTVSALAPGDAWLVASVDGEPWAWVSFSVAPAPPPLASIAVSPSPAAVAAGATVQLTATGTYQDGTTADLTAQVTWRSSAPTVATFHATGLASGVTPGETTVTAELGAIVSPPVVLTVTSDVVLLAIDLSPAGGSVPVGGTLGFLATGRSSDGSTGDVTLQVAWSTSDAALATIAADGTALGKAPGAVSVGAALGGVMAPPVTLTVTVPVVTPRVGVARTGALLSATPGDDGWWKPGVAWPSPRFTAPGAAALDRLTGLEWARDASGQFTGVTCAGVPADRSAGLTHAQAMLLLGCLNAAGLGGQSDWRMPNAVELMSLLDAGDQGGLPVGHPFTGAGGTAWSSTTLPKAGSLVDVAWTFGGTSGRWVARSDPYYRLWPVRGGVAGPTPDVAWPVNLPRSGATVSQVAGDDGALQRGVAAPVPRFVPAWGIGTSASQRCGNVDALTGLAWSSYWAPVTWGSGIRAVHGVPMCGFTDWRIPTAAELRTLLDFSAAGSLDFLAAAGLTIPWNGNLSGATVWSSTPDARFPTFMAHAIDFMTNGVGPTTESNSQYLFLVRGPGRLPAARVTLTSIEVAPASAALALGETLQLTATATLSDGSRVDLTTRAGWASSASAVATVSAQGLATGLAAGSAQVSATFDGLTSPLAVLSVAAAPLVGDAFKVVLSGGHAYVAGYWNDGAKDVPCVWIDGARIDVAGDGVHSARAGAVAVEGGVVFLGGSWSDGVKLTPAVWTGAVRADLLGDGANDAAVAAISVLGGVVTAGGYWKDGVQGHPALWTLTPGQAAVRTDLPGDLAAGVRDDPMVLRVLQQGGHTYATGWVRDGYYSRAALWVDGARTILPDLIWSYGNGLAVDAGTTYVAGNVYDGGKYLASLWVNGVRTDLPHDGVHDASYLAATVSGGQLVLGGAVNDGTSYLPSTWVNGVRTTLPGTTTARGDYPVFDVAVDAGTIHAVGHTSDAAGSHPAHWVGATRLELGAPALQGLTVTAPFASVPQGSTLQLTATASYAGGLTVDVTRFATWSSSAPGALAVGATGLAAGVTAGAATVTAALAGVASPPLAVAVTPPFTGNASSVVRAGGHTYVSGWWGDGTKHVPAYWVDGVRHDLAGDGLHDADASRIAVDGGSVHVSGSWTDAAGLTHAAVWSDGVRTDLPERVVGYRSYATDVTAVGGTVHLSGSSFDGYGGLPCTWSGSPAGGFVRTDLPGDLSVGSPRDATANAIAVDGGTVYAAGWVRDWYYATPSVFIGASRTSLPLPNNDLGGYWGFPTGLRVVGGTPYVSLVQSIRPGGYRAALYVGPPASAVRTQFEGDGVHDAMASGLEVAGGVAYLSGAWSDGAVAHPCYWAGVTRIELPGTGPLPSGGLPWPTGGIAVDAGSVFVAGALDNGAGGVKPVLWVDGVASDLR